MLYPVPRLRDTKAGKGGFVREKIAAIIVKSYYSSEPPEQRALRAAGEIEALLTKSLPFEGLTLEEHNQVVRGIYKALKDYMCPDHPCSCLWFEETKGCECWKALTLNGKPVKVRNSP